VLHSISCTGDFAAPKLRTCPNTQNLSPAVAVAFGAPCPARAQFTLGSRRTLLILLNNLLGNDTYLAPAKEFTRI